MGIICDTRSAEDGRGGEDGYLVAVAKTTKKKDDLADYASKFASRGGKALSPEKRRELARQAALARWNKVRK